MNNSETNSGAHDGAVQTRMRLIGCLDDTDTLEDVEDAARYHHIDIALELVTPQKLRIYAVLPEVS